MLIKMTIKALLATLVLTQLAAYEPAHSLEKKTAPTVTQPRLSVQLWSVREDVAADFKSSISKLADMGFEGIELAGDVGEFTDDPSGLAQFVASKGMTISGAHVNYESLSDENFEQTVSFYKRAGVPMLMIGYDARMGKADEVDDAIAELNDLHSKVSAQGLSFGYHNHEFEFSETSNGKQTFWDQLAQSTPPSFVMQIDVGWVNYAGKDPVSFVTRYPGRTISTHYKATLNPEVKDKLPIIGQDSLDWGSLYDANRTVGGTLWLVVEQEEYPNGLTAMEALKMSKQGLDNILKKHKSAK